MNSYKYFKDVSLFYSWCMTKYFDYYDIDGNKHTDNNFVLTPEDDAACVILGGNWRTPTIDEWKELIDNCTRVEIQVNGVRGTKFYNKQTNDITQFIFLPYSGYNDDISVFFDGGYSGYYWSASLAFRQGEYYSSGAGNVSVCGATIYLGDPPRWFGESVRAVCK